VLIGRIVTFSGHAADLKAAVSVTYTRAILYSLPVAGADLPELTLLHVPIKKRESLTIAVNDTDTSVVRECDELWLPSI